MEENITHLVAHLILQLAVILFAAKIGGELAGRFLKQPPVLGELAVGVIISPYALGALPVPLLGPLFPLQSGGTIPITPELFSFAQVASVILLFFVGLETDLDQFLRYGPVAAAVAVGGVILPFIFGDVSAILFGFADSVTHPTALFMGAILTATSVGITARVLSDIGKLDTAEGVTIIGGAVVDDVLGILVLAIAGGIAVTGSVSPLEVGVVGAKALGFWIALTGVALLIAMKVSRFFQAFRGEGAALALALAIAFFGAYLAESFGLALIIGAYSIGLALSRTPLAHQIQHEMQSVYHALVPVFFVVMGMLVDLSSIGHALVFGIIVTILAIISKVIGAALPAFVFGFTNWGALRVGLGMLPRGEVALIVAGVGLTTGIIDNQIFGVAILVTAVTTLIAPILLVPAFQNGAPGHRQDKLARAEPQPAVSSVSTAIPDQRFVVDLDPAVATLFARHLRTSLERDGFALVGEVHDPDGPEVMQFRQRDKHVSVALEPLEAGRRRLILESETPRWGDMLSQALHDSASEMIMSLVEPIIAKEDGAAISKLRQSLADLLGDLDGADVKT